MNVSNDLSFNNHIYIICKKAYWVINNIFRSFCCKDTNVYIKAYSSYVRPHLEYASCIWSPYKVGIKKILKKYKNVLLGGFFIGYNIVYVPYLGRLEILKLQNLKLRRLICDLCMCFNILKAFVDCNLKRCLVLNRGQNRLGSSI